MSSADRASSDASSSRDSKSPESSPHLKNPKSGSLQNANQNSAPSSSASASAAPPRAQPLFSFRHGRSASPSIPPPSAADVASLREQWKYALRMYSVQYANAWGGVIVAGVCLYGLGWYIKGEDPLKDIRKQEAREGAKGGDKGKGEEGR